VRFPALLIAFILTPAAFGSMAAIEQMETSKIMTALEKANLDDSGRRTLSLLKFGVDALKLGSVTVPMGAKPADTSLQQVKYGVEEAIFSRPWNEAVTAPQAEYIKTNRAFLIKTFGDSYAWAWLAAQSGAKDEARAHLLKRFDSEYKRVMAAQETTPFGHPLLREVEAIHKALTGQLPKAQMNEVNSKMRTMKSHVSKLPDAGIVT
jgi:hypothetical protein